MMLLSAIAAGGQQYAVDTHAHVFTRGLPLATVRRYAPDYDVTAAEYLQRLDQHGLTHGVLVQPSFLGSDNSYLLAALRAHPQRLRGIAMVDDDISEEQLQHLHAAGVVGIRFNLIGGAAVPDFGAPAWQRVLSSIAQRGWQVEIHREARDLQTIVPVLLDTGVKLVIDHFGRPDPELALNDPGFRYLLDLGATGRVWVKLSAAYRTGGMIAGQRMAAAALPLLRQAYGLSRLLWGSDWPHTQHERLTDYTQQCHEFCTLMPLPEERQVVLATAANLYQFD